MKVYIALALYGYQCGSIFVWQQQWLVSDRATDGSVPICVFVNAQMCVYLCLKQCSEVLGDLSGGVEVASLWQCDRAGLSLSVMDEHSQGEHLSFLSFLFPFHPTCPLFHWDWGGVWPISFGCFWPSECEWLFPVFLVFAVMVCIIFRNLQVTIKTNKWQAVLSDKNIH